MIETVLLDTANLSNASSGLQATSGNSFGLVGTALLTVLLAVALVFVGSHASRIEWLHTKLKAFSRSLYYTAVGLASTLVLGVVVTPMWYLSQADGQTQTYALYAVGGVILAYIAFTGLGYVVDKIMLSSWREYREQEVADNA